MAKKRSFLLIAGLGCLGLMLVCTGGMAAFGFAAFKMLKSSGPYADAMERVRASPDAVAALGEPIEADWLVSGNVHEDLARGGSANLSIPVHGPKGTGVVKVEGERTGKRWSYSTLVLVLADGKTVDLGSASPPTSRPPRGSAHTPASAAQTSQSL